MTFLRAALILLFLIPNPFSESQAQDLKIGLKGGINISTLSGPPSSTDDVSARLLYHVGVFAAKEVADKIEAQAELLFSAQGATEDNDFAASKIRLNFTYLNIPLIGKYQVAEGICIYAGIQPGIRLTAEGKILEGQFQGTQDAKDDTKAFDFALIFGGYYQIQENLFVEARFVPGLVDIEQDAPIFRNQLVQFSVGYILVGN